MTTRDMKELTEKEREAVHREAESRISTFAYEKPADDPADTKPKKILRLERSEHLLVAVQVVKEGGENNLHYHTNSDGAWMVLKGRAKFYGVGDKLLGDLGPQEGIVLPGGSRYWFEKSSDEDLEILQIFGYAGKEMKASRVNIDAHKDWMEGNAATTVYDEPAKAEASK